MVENIFEYAAEHKLRFPFKGSISTEDLFDLSLVDLDSIYKTLNREMKKAEEDSLLSVKSNSDVALGVKIEIVKFIVSKKLDAIEARKKALADKDRLEKLLNIKAKREESALEQMSDDELEKAIASLVH